MAAQPASDPNRRGKTVYLLFNHPIQAARRGRLATSVEQHHRSTLTCHARNHKDSYQSALFSLHNQQLPLSLSSVSLKRQLPFCIYEKELFVGPTSAVENG